MAIHILLCSSDEYLMGQLKIMLQEERNLISLYSFSDCNQAESYLKRNSGQLQCLLTDEKRLVENVFAESALVKMTLIQLGEETVWNGDHPSVLNVYQRRQNLMEDFKQLLRSAHLLASSRSHNQSTKVISFFSTQGGCGTSTLSYLSAIKGAEHGRAVYLNLEHTPCTDIFYQQGTAAQAEEFLCALKDRADPTVVLPAALWRNEHGVLVFPTPTSLVDQRDLSGEDVSFLIEGLSGLGDIDFVLVDLSAGLSEINEAAMSISDRVVLIYQDNVAGRAKQEKFLNDPAFSGFPCAGREFLVHNQCMQQGALGTCKACFPYSKSLADNRDKKLVLQGNPAFSEGCEKILHL